jgi:general stress protein CsbA
VQDRSVYFNVIQYQKFTNIVLGFIMLVNFKKKYFSSYSQISKEAIKITLSFPALLLHDARFFFLYLNKNNIF